MITALGLVAGMLTTGCWLPQLVRSWRTRSTTDFSWAYLAVLTVGVTLWLTYGIVNVDLAMIVANGSALAALLTLITFKIVFDRGAAGGTAVETTRSPARGQQDVVPYGVDAGA